MSSRPREALEFFRAIAAGDVVLNAKDPSHAHALKAACGSLEHYASLAESVPELAEAVAGLAPGEGSAEEQLERQLSVLRRVLQAIAERRDAVEAKLDELRRAELAKNAPSFSLGSPDDPWFEGVVAIDLGSSNVVCARWNFQAVDNTNKLEKIADSCAWCSLTLLCHKGKRRARRNTLHLQKLVQALC